MVTGKNTHDDQNKPRARQPYQHLLLRERVTVQNTDKHHLLASRALACCVFRTPPEKRLGGSAELASVPTRKNKQRKKQLPRFCLASAYGRERGRSPYAQRVQGDMHHRDYELTSPLPPSSLEKHDRGAYPPAKTKQRKKSSFQEFRLARMTRAFFAHQ